jgi:hypothetical protein
VAFDKEFIKGVEEKTDAIIAKIAQKEEPAERLEHYQALQQGLYQLYSGGKPAYFAKGTVPISGAFGVIGAYFGMVGLLVAAPIAAPGALAVLFGAAALGGAGGAGLGYKDQADESKALREKFGNVRNARKLYKIEKKVGKLIEKEQGLIDKAKEQADRLAREEVFRKEMAESEKIFRTQIESLEGKKPQAAPAPAAKDAAEIKSVDEEKQPPAAPVEEKKPSGATEAKKPAKTSEKPNYDLLKGFGS